MQVIPFFALALLAMVAAASEGGAPLLPAFTTDAAGDWFNSAPLRTSDLRGQVVLVDVWTLGCANCCRSKPWLKAVEARFAGRPFRVVGIHSPEFAGERVRGRPAEKIAALGLRHPVMMDHDLAN